VEINIDLNIEYNITQNWNANAVAGSNSHWQVPLFDLQAGQSYSGAGFTFQLPLSQANQEVAPAVSVFATSC